MIIALFTAFGVWVLYGVVSYMTYDMVEESQHLYQQYEAAKQIERVFEQTYDVRDMLGVRIIEGDDDILRLIDDMEEMGISAGVEFTLEDIHKKRETTDDEEEELYLEISVSTQGSWEDSMTYVALLEAYPWNIVVKEINLQYNGEEDLWKGLYTFQLLNVIF